MLETIKESYSEIIREYYLTFQTDRYGGYSFPCDKDGNVVDLNPSAMANYQKCISGDIATIQTPFVDYFDRVYRRPKVCKCDCGYKLEMECDSEGLVYCHCGKCYNSSGASIRPRSEWEERYDDDY